VFSTYECVHMMETLTQLLYHLDELVLLDKKSSASVSNVFMIICYIVSVSVKSISCTVFI